MLTLHRPEPILLMIQCSAFNCEVSHADGRNTAQMYSFTDQEMMTLTSLPTLFLSLLSLSNLLVIRSTKKNHELYERISQIIKLAYFGYIMLGFVTLVF